MKLQEHVLSESSLKCAIDPERRTVPLGTCLIKRDPGFGAFQLETILDFQGNLFWLWVGYAR